MTKAKKKKVIVAMSPHKSPRDCLGQAGGDERRRIVVAMSGGVDSSVAAKLLKDQGHELMGIFLHFWKEENPPHPLYPADAEALADKQGGTNPPSPSASSTGQALYSADAPAVVPQGGTIADKQRGLVENKCCSAEALMDARRVCQKINISFYTLNFSDVFKKEIVDNFLDEYERGNTPNPCVRCNKLVKLGLLINRAKELGFDCVASGHYARLRREITNYKLSPLWRDPAHNKYNKVAGQIPNKIQNSKFKKTKFIYKLFRAKDRDKDQSYFLYTLTQEQLKHLLFPLGDYTKEEVRKLAKKFSLPVVAKKESQEICFIPEKSHNEFLKRNIKMKSGPIKTLDGVKVGEHQGLPLYTIGQRKGVAIGGIGPFYVVKADYKTNTLYVVKDGNDTALYRDKLIAKDVNWLSGVEPKLPLSCEAVIRYRHKPVKCKIKKHENTETRKHRNTKTQKHEKQEKYLVNLAEPQRAITPGQSVVFYKGNEVLGGGTIA